jgi:hypothetical protein
MGGQMGASAAEAVPEVATVLRTFLQEVLPVLLHVAALAQGEGGVSSIHARDGSAQVQPQAAVCSGLCGPDASTCRLGGPCNIATGRESSTSSSSSTRPAVEGSVPGANVSVPAAASSVPVENTLFLLRAAAGILGHCLRYAVSNEVAYEVISQGMQRAGASPDQPHSKAACRGQPDSCNSSYRPTGVTDDLATAPGAVMSLICALISKGPWWEEARAKYPLLLIQTLVELIAVRGSTKGTLAYASVLEVCPSINCIYLRTTWQVANCNCHVSTSLMLHAGAALRAARRVDCQGACCSSLEVHHWAAHPVPTAPSRSCASNRGGSRQCTLRSGSGRQSGWYHHTPSWQHLCSGHEHHHTVDQPHGPPVGAAL